MMFSDAIYEGFKTYLYLSPKLDLTLTYWNFPDIFEKMRMYEFPAVDRHRVTDIHPYTPIKNENENENLAVKTAK
jgi:hypothetical protein